jgi:hypothetical protein
MAHAVFKREHELPAVFFRREVEEKSWKSALRSGENEKNNVLYYFCQ